MRRRMARRITPCIPAALLLIAMFLLPKAQAYDPRLTIQVTGGGDASFALSEIEQMGFAGEATFVVVTASGTHSYAMATILGITFLWEPTSVLDPENDPEETTKLLTVLRLFQNQPNPFSPETRIIFDLPSAGKVDLGIYSPDGRRVRTLISGERSAGRQEVTWDGRDDAGRAAPAGVYFYSLTSPRIAESRQMILLPR